MWQILQTIGCICLIICFNPQQPKEICALGGFCSADMKKSIPMMTLEAAMVVPAAKAVPALQLFPATKLKPAADKSVKVSCSGHLLTPTALHSTIA